MTSIDQIPFTFLDCETTGLSPRYGDKICEIALLKVRGWEVQESYQTLVNPGRPISPGAMAVNGITDAVVQDAPSFSEIAEKLIRIIGDSVIVAHNAKFDLSFLSAQFQNARVPLFDNVVIDTLIFARRYYHFPSNSLGNICTFLNFSVKDEHRAMGDVVLTRMVFEKFLTDFKERGIATLEEVISLQGGPVVLQRDGEISLPPLLDEALRSRSKVRINYISANRRESIRVIEPLEVTSLGDYLYLLAFCYLRQEKRTFRLDRVISLQMVEDPAV
jgi:DNA polymerase III epsilon subunit family exonuclease